jgi:dihydrofolate reductase
MPARNKQAMSTPKDMPSITIIVAATSSHLGIGLKGSLPWRLKQELAYFKRATTFHPENRTNVVIMGRKCWESIPPKFRPLPNRHNLVLSRQAHMKEIIQASKGAEHASSLSQALGRVRDGFGRVFVIGGADVSREAMGLENCDRILFTEVNGDVETDVDFPVEFRRNGLWKKANHEKLEEFVGGEVPEGNIEEGTLTYEFQMWERNQ